MPTCRRVRSLRQPKPVNALRIPLRHSQTQVTIALPRIKPGAVLHNLMGLSILPRAVGGLGGARHLRCFGAKTAKPLTQARASMSYCA
jgi:hypothetical protein